MGIKAVKSHSENQKHLRLATLQSGAETSIASFWHSSESSPAPVVGGPTVQQNQPVPIPGTTGSDEASSSDGLSKVPAATAKTPFFSLDEQRIRDEIYWLLHMIDSHFGFNSAAGISDLFRLMFSDSTVAQQFKMADDKSRYVAVYGLETAGR